VLKQRENYISEHSMQARELVGKHFEAIQPKKPRNKPQTNQRLTHRFKGPQTGGNRLNLMLTTLYPFGDPPSSVSDERQPPVLLSFSGKNPVLSPRWFTRFPCITPPEIALGGLYKEEERTAFNTQQEEKRRAPL
jgi:hypothetical protein